MSTFEKIRILRLTQMSQFGHLGCNELPKLFFPVLILVISLQGVESATFTIANKCDFTVWPGILSNEGTQQPSTTGFTLQPGQSAAVPVPTSWSGRIWGRTSCTQNMTTGLFTCLTGDCCSSTVECSVTGASPPATLAEFTLDGAGGLDFYNVSLVDGYNLPMLVAPQGGTCGKCSITGCTADLNLGCPKELQVDGDSKSACDAFGDAQFCCSGSYSTPSTYSEFFKSACPSAYSYAYDDGTSTFTCASADYVITFCPSPSTRAAGDYSKAVMMTDAPGAAGDGALQASVASHSRWRPPSTTAYVALAAVLAVGFRHIFG